MAEGRSRMLWRHTSAIMCLLANLNRDPKRTRPYSPDRFDPHEVADRGRRKVHERRITVAQLADEIMALAGRNGKRR